MSRPAHPPRWLVGEIQGVGPGLAVYPWLCHRGVYWRDGLRVEGCAEVFGTAEDAARHLMESAKEAKK